MHLTNYFSLGLLTVALLTWGGCKEEDNLKVEIFPRQDNACEQIAEVVCHNSYQCCVGVELENTYGIKITTDEKDCRKDVQLTCENIYARELDAIAEGRANLNTVGLGRCLEYMLAPPDVCSPFQVVDQTMVEECDEVEDMLIGQVQVDGPCRDDFDCAAQAYCGGDMKCKNPSPLGQPCSSHSDCLPALHCAYDQARMENICQQDSGDGGPCNASFECADGLYCKTTESTAGLSASYIGVCATPAANGTPCSSDYSPSMYDELSGTYYSYDADAECQGGVCLGGFCADGRDCEMHADCTGTCSESGTACAADADCASTCVGGYYDGYSCSSALDCLGICSLSSYTCSAAADCGSVCVSSTGAATTVTCTDTAYCESYYGTGYTCETQTCDVGTCTSTEMCVGASTCTGRVCADTYEIVDYCELGWSWLNAYGNGPSISGSN